MHTTTPSWVFAFLVETRFHHVGQACFKLLTSNDPHALAFHSAGITSGLGMSHCAWPRYSCFQHAYLFKTPLETRASLGWKYLWYTVLTTASTSQKEKETYFRLEISLILQTHTNFDMKGTLNSVPIHLTLYMEAAQAQEAQNAYENGTLKHAHSAQGFFHDATGPRGLISNNK